MPITVTETAVREIRRVLDNQQKPEWGIRVAVQGGGCSGMSYKMDPDEKPAEKDQVFEYDGVKVFCDPKSYLFLNGLILDYSTDLMGGGFKFVNPNATKTCGCGQSFAA